jgi:hypothetical protein
MKKLLFIPFLLISLGLSAQVFNTSSTLKRRSFSVGFEPGVYAGGGSSFALFLHGGVGITSNVDLGLKIGLIDGPEYIGGDVEFDLGKYFSLSAGAHSWGNFGLDATGLFTFPIKSDVHLYTGLDMDIVFEGDDNNENTDDTHIPLWIPIGLEVKMRSNMAFLFEAEINVTDYGRHFFGGGLNFYF